MQDKDFKYILQDAGSIYIGTRYPYEELIQQEQLPFKLKTILMQYILKETKAFLTLEEHFASMTADSFSYGVYKELKVKIKVSIPEERKTFTGKIKRRYVDKIYPLEELVSMRLEEKAEKGIIIREIIYSKIGLLSFSV